MKSIEESRENIDSLLKQGEELYSKGEFVKASKFFLELVKISPNNLEAWNDLGVVLVKLEMLEKAKICFQRALSIDPDYIAAKENLASISPPQIAKEPETIDYGSIEELPLRFQGKAVIWYSTMKCNNRCPYCLAFRVRDPMINVPFYDYRKWVAAWNLIGDGDDFILDITGGEPFLVPNLVELINELNLNIKVAITTNLKSDITQFVQEIPPERILSMTLSLHPSSDMNIDYFIGKTLLLKNRGYPVCINYVAYPEQLWLIPHFKQQFENLGIRFHVDPYAPTPDRPYSLSQKERDFLNRFVGMDRQDTFESKKRVFKCTGGANFFCVPPNGDAYTCVTKRYVKGHYLGNIFDKNFKLRKKPIICEAISCAGCDLDKVTRVKMEEIE